MMLLQIQCHFGLAPIDVVAVALDISWPQPLLLLTSFLLPFASLSSALGSGLCFHLGKGSTNCFCLQLLHLPSSPHVATLVHKLEVFSNFKVLFCYLVLFLEMF